MDRDMVLHTIRNAWGKSAEEMREARVAAGDLIEQQEREIATLKQHKNTLLETVQLLTKDSRALRARVAELEAVLKVPCFNCPARASASAGAVPK